MKKLLISLFVGFVGIISFCSSVYLGKSVFSDTNVSANSSTGYSVFVSSNNINCFYISNPSNFSCTFNGYTVSNNSQSLCFQNDTVEISCSNTSNLSRVIRRQIIYLDNLTGYCPDCPTCDSQYTSLECQTEYNLIPIEEVDVNYCISNNLCPATDFSGNWSSLFINDIQHESSENINIVIPEEIAWDYTGNEEVFNVYVSGYNVDTDYIAGIIQTQNSKPSQGDLNKLVSEVLPLFVPGLAVILFLYFIFRFIKKVF